MRLFRRKLESTQHDGGEFRIVDTLFIANSWSGFTVIDVGARLS
jgi:hypothetical protein